RLRLRARAREGTYDTSAANDAFCNASRLWKAQGAAIFNRRLLEVGDFKSPLLGLQVRDHLDLRGLWEHVQRRDRADFETLLQFGDVASHRRWVARDVDHRARRAIEEDPARFSRKTSGGRINDQRCRGEIALLQEQ